MPRGGAEQPVSVALPAALVRWSLYLCLASIPFEIPERTTLPVEVPTLFGAIFVLASLLQPRLCFRRPPAPFWWFASYLFVYALATSLNFLNDWSEVLQLFLLIVQNILVFWAAYNLLQDGRVSTAALVTFLIACTVRAGLPMVGIGRTTHAVWTGGSRLTWFGQNENNSAMILGAGLIVLIGLTYGRERSAIRPRLLAWPLAVLLAVAVVETGSRGGMAALAAGLLAFLAFNKPPSALERLRNAAVGLLTLGVLLWAAYASPMMHDRLADTAGRGAMAGRENLYPILLQMFREKPILGWGPLNNHYELSLRELNEGEGVRFLNQRDSHNLLLETLSSTGLVGTLVFWPGIVLCVLAAWRARAGPEGVLPLAILATELVANMSGNYMASKAFWLFLALAPAAYTRAGQQVSGGRPSGRASVRAASGVTSGDALL
jgi:O-antigen ligase